MVHAKKGIEDSSQIQKTMPMEVPKKKKKKGLKSSFKPRDKNNISEEIIPTEAFRTEH